MKLSLYSALLLAAGCSGNTYQQKPPTDDIGMDSGGENDTDTDSDSDTDTDTDSDTDADTDSDTDADTDSDTDADTDADTDTDVALCTNRLDPQDASGYIRYYDVTLFGTAGTGQQEGWGTGWATSGEQTYVMYDEVAGSTAGWSGSVYIGCDVAGTPGMYVVEWDVSADASGTSLGSLIAALDSPRKYLPAESEIGTIGTWAYSYSSIVNYTGIDVTVDVTGTYSELGTDSITLYDGNTYDAYHLLNEYTLTATIESFGYELTSYDGELEQWYVDGLGLVREENTNLNDGSSVMSRELTGYSGLTPR